MTPRKDHTPHDESHLSREDIERFTRMETGIERLLESTASIQEQQAKQYAGVMKRVIDVEKYQAQHLTERRIEKWDAASDLANKYLNEDEIERRNSVYETVEKAQDRLGLLLAIGGVVLTALATASYWVMEHIILPLITRRGGM